ncbi:MAG: T9SS type A sorting domain-containing protein [Ignavibacteriales bacterium]|nr:T9SS type A sorting domain-containing protein [Ignavibacteriales bacterium]
MIVTPTNITFSNNNLFYSTNSNLIIFKIGSQYEYNWNEWILGGYEALSRNEDPIFENNEQPYMITSGSPAIDLGETLPNEFAFDFLGKTRPFNDLFDAGVYEYYDVQKKMILSSMEHELSEFELFNNFPNPFNPSTTINFSLADSKVSLKIFDVIGQEVAQLVNGQLAAGQHNVNFDARSLNSGVYFYKIEANGVDGTSYVQ